MKIDMPNPHAIYLHDTPSRGLFNSVNRAYSHGCVRTERAQELGMTMAILGADLTPEQGVEHALSGKYTKVPMTKTFPVYITYFTMAQDITGKLARSPTSTAATCRCSPASPSRASPRPASAPAPRRSSSWTIRFECVGTRLMRSPRKHPRLPVAPSLTAG